MMVFVGPMSVALVLMDVLGVSIGMSHGTNEDVLLAFGARTIQPTQIIVVKAFIVLLRSKLPFVLRDIIARKDRSDHFPVMHSLHHVNQVTLKGHTTPSQFEMRFKYCQQRSLSCCVAIREHSPCG
jgi:hypothetical protein